MKIIKGTRGCVFCKQSALDELDFGELKVTKNLRAHYYCLLFSETITQSGRDNQGILGFLPSDILSELCRSKQKQCFYCKEFGATAGCANKFCNTKFHLSCGMENRIQQNFDTFTSYCHKHRKCSNVPARIRKVINNYKCVICLENFHAKIDMTKVIWADCCKAEILLHLQCMKRLALNAGYFTKCPGCNNKTEFITTIKARGVFVPERDASWELANNAYSELYYVHETCDITKCLCPHGRKFSLDRGKWKLFLCKLCGSYGTHQFCSQVQNEFTCSVCNSINGNSVIACENAPTSLTSTANNTKFDEIGSPAGHKTANANEIREVSTIDPLDDIIIVDCFEDSDDNSELNKETNFSVLDRISNEITIKTEVILDRPTTSKAETKSALTCGARKVATKSTTKLPYLKEKPTNPTIFPQSSSCGELNNTKASVKHVNKTLTERFNTKSSHSNKDRRIAIKSTTKLPFPKKDIGDLENTIKLEKQTINSLDDVDEVIIIDSDEEETNISNISDANSKILTDTPLRRPLLNNILKPVSSVSHTERMVALKSTTKLPHLKRKHSNDENTLLNQCKTRPSEFARINKIIENCNINIQSGERPTKKFKENSVARTSTTHKSTRLCNLIKKVHTVIGSQSVCEADNFCIDQDCLGDVRSSNKIKSLYTDENLHYTIPLNLDSEIEFVNCPNFTVNGQVRKIYLLDYLLSFGYQVKISPR